MAADTTQKKGKKKRKRLHVYPRNLLAVSGVLQVSLLSVHIDAITRMQAVIIGFYLLAFILLTTLNILNGFGFSSRPGISAVLGTLMVTLLQLVFGSLYLMTMIAETSFFTSESSIPAMPLSSALFLLGMIGAFVAIYFELKVFRHADDIYKYMM